MAVADGTVKVNVYVVCALAAELPMVTERSVICAAETWLARPTTDIDSTATAMMRRERTFFICVSFLFLFFFTSSLL